MQDGRPELLPQTYLANAQTHPELAHWRADKLRSLTAVLEVLARWMVPCHTSSPGWDTLIRETGLSRSTVAARLADAHDLGLVRTLQGGEVHDAGNLRAVYVLQLVTANPVNQSRTPPRKPSLRSGFPRKTDDRFAALSALPKDQPTPPELYPEVARALCEEVLWLKRAHRGNVRKVIEDALRQGSQLIDLLHACEQNLAAGRPFGTPPVAIENPCGLLRGRIKQLHGNPKPRSGRLAASREDADRRIGRQLAERQAQPAARRPIRWLERVELATVTPLSVNTWLQETKRRNEQRRSEREFCRQELEHARSHELAEGQEAWRQGRDHELAAQQAKAAEETKQLQVLAAARLHRQSKKEPTAGRLSS